MLNNINKNIICVKDIPSNLIEEAIFILKSDVESSNLEIRQEIAQEEAEEFLGEYIYDIEKIYTKDKKKKYKVNKKVVGMTFVGIFVICIILFVF